MTWSIKKRAVLAPFDFSMPARRALTIARSFVESDGALHVLHVAVPFVTAGPYPVGLDMAEVARSHEKLLESALAAEGANDATAVVEVGQPAETIVAYAEKNGIELIVIPTHGRTGMDRFFIGSVAERVVRLAQCPVLVVRAEAEPD